MKFPQFIVLLFASVFLASCRGGVPIRVEKEHSIRDLLSPHTNPSITLIVGTNRIHNVLGSPPYYLKIPEWEAIFVATETKDHHFYYHVVSLKDQSDSVIDGGSLGFGYGIGNPNSYYKESISKVQDHQLTLTAKNAKRRINYVLDLDRRTVVSIETEDLNPEGKVTGRTLQEFK